MSLLDRFLVRVPPRSFAVVPATTFTPARVVPRAMGPRDDVITAAATDVSEYTGTKQFATGDQGWQNELWEFYETLGEFAFVVNWKASVAGRIRLRAGRLEPDADEPTIESSGVAADLVRKLADVTGGHTTLLTDLMIQLGVPAEGWLVGETRDGVEYWNVKSNAELRRGRGRGSSRDDSYEVLDENAPPGTTEWRTLGPDSLVVRVWRPHPRKHNEAWSRARSARTTMHELDLVNRKIVAQYLSRLASAGILLLPDEMEFPVRPEFVDAANPFFRELIAVASEAIKTPGSAAATVPIPLTGPAELIEKVKHLDLSITMDQKEVEKRDSVLRRLGTQLDVPAEILSGIGASNHWGAWAIDEQAFKAHVAPDVELLCAALTASYLRPRLAATGEDPSEWAVWYDASEVIQRPDKSEHADVAFKALAINKEAYRRELGFDEADAPTDEEVQAELIARLALDPTAGRELIRYIGDVAAFLKDQEEKDAAAEERADKMADALANPDPDEDPEIDNDGPPATEDDAPPSARGPRPVREAAQARLDAYLERLLDQAKVPHRVTYSAVGAATLLHPASCREHLPSCPFTHAYALRSPSFRPGTSGTYELRLTADGALALGQRHVGSNDGYLEFTPGIIHFNGHRRESTVRR